MSKKASLMATFDWIQIQFKKSAFCLDDIFQLLFMSSEYFINKLGRLEHYNYDTQAIYQNIRIYQGDNEDSYMLVMSGEALKWFRENVLYPLNLTEKQFLQNIINNNNLESFSVRRIDVAIDDLNDKPFFTPSQLLKVCQKKRYVYGKSRFYTTYGDEQTGVTLYLRKPDDDERLRIYDKRLEQVSKENLDKRDIVSWIRTELILKKDKATYFLLDFFETERDLLDFSKGYLKEKVYFYSDSKFTKRLRAWDKFLGTSTNVKITIPSKDTLLEQRIKWFVFQGAASTWKAIKFCLENDLFTEKEWEKVLEIDNALFSAELASDLMERARTKGKTELIKEIKNNTKKRGR
ncbi:replication initiation factor domain-containing protein [Enterococcus cecorum]|uniref:replication initiation factor domain-containing protein n=1 Tax=Enterococcus cecorum TaxID=44008 RepID=UPI00148DA1AD|nr:replication initiation factor domain-containing protein [Enterococcus cecorum]MCJ0537856.1 replication initiation factor domain-containing protein [Enterococcus cecorum]MCJ0545323.1 replication initiation factor domain-containing protein [Enterococcus cecorum]MCJ0551946.1 replication initiation factor domain-containing protein [Enterococcus cecorum]MCJ0568166.1 replication initiation factor domain-containing protein [Enterococcus cecorum]